MDGCEEDDNYSQADSDNEEQLIIELEDTQTFLKKLQGDQPVQEHHHQDNDDRYFSQTDHIQKNISHNIHLEKKKQIALMPTKTYD